ncbi:MAG: DUF4065 domain-containing protein [Microcella pacifica]|uniref:SocA family protein n=1 Tax=Microcella pacifica TaxID=2591847 RepID=A0A9E5JMR7_9MICO|nr:type II toxin-antitoxin system antitoxin SocA domain-containing protein [Microcella pacifica]NHF63563.1 SocA family protein [Microcella pacifica]
MSARTANEVANWFLAWAESEDAELDNLKLQKLLYYAQGHAFAALGQELFNDEIQAWAHGPVVPSIYRRFKSCGASPIPAEQSVPSDFDWDDYRDVESFLQRVWNTYGKYASWTLRNMTHRESPWLEHFNADERSAVIPKSALRTYFAN